MARRASVLFLPFHYSTYKQIIKTAVDLYLGVISPMSQSTTTMVPFDPMTSNTLCVWPFVSGGRNSHVVCFHRPEWLYWKHVIWSVSTDSELELKLAAGLGGSRQYKIALIGIGSCPIKYECASAKHRLLSGLLQNSLANCCSIVSSLGKDDEIGNGLHSVCWRGVIEASVFFACVPHLYICSNADSLTNIAVSIETNLTSKNGEKCLTRIPTWCACRYGKIFQMAFNDGDMIGEVEAGWEDGYCR